MNYFKKLLNFRKYSVYIFTFCMLCNITNGFTISEQNVKSTFKYIRSASLVGQLYCRDDIISFKDSKQLFAKVDGSFTLSFPFGNWSISLEDTCIIATFEEKSLNKLKVITKEGLSYIGDISSFEYSYFYPEKPLEKNEISLETLDFIFLQPTVAKLVENYANLFTIVLKNGSSFPAAIKERKLILGNVINQFIIDTERLSEITFPDDKLTVKNFGDFHKIDLPAFLVENNFITLDIPHVSNSVELPWNEIFKIYKENKTDHYSNASILSSVDLDVCLALGEDIDFGDWGGKGDEEESGSEIENEGDRIDFISMTVDSIDDSLICFETENIVGVEGHSEMPVDNEIDNQIPDEISPLELMENHKTIRERLEMLEGEPDPENIEQEPEEEQTIELLDVTRDEKKLNKTTKNVPKYEDAHNMIYIPSSDPGKSGLYLSKDLVTNADYERFVEAIKYRYPSYWKDGKPPLGLETKPVVNVSYQDAFLYAIWVGMRLPAKDELMRALNLDKRKFFGLDNYFEWTSSPFSKEEVPEMDLKRIFLKERAIPEHAVFAIDQTPLMSNDDHNNQTSFRVARDAH